MHSQNAREAPRGPSFPNNRNDEQKSSALSSSHLSVQNESSPFQPAPSFLNRPTSSGAEAVGGSPSALGPRSSVRLESPVISVDDNSQSKTDRLPDGNSGRRNGQFIFPAPEETFTLFDDVQIFRKIETHTHSPQELTELAAQLGKSPSHTIQRAQFLRQANCEATRQLLAAAKRWSVYSKLYLLSTNSFRDLFIEPLNELVRHNNELIWEIREILGLETSLLLFGQSIPDKKIPKRALERMPEATGLIIPPYLLSYSASAGPKTKMPESSGEKPIVRVLVDEGQRLDRSFRKFRIHHLFDRSKDYKFPHLFRPGTVPSLVVPQVSDNETGEMVIEEGELSAVAIDQTDAP